MKTLSPERLAYYREKYGVVPGDYRLKGVCLSCGGPIALALEQLGSPWCHDCRDKR